MRPLARAGLCRFLRRTSLARVGTRPRNATTRPCRQRGGPPCPGLRRTPATRPCARRRRSRFARSRLPRTTERFTALSRRRRRWTLPRHGSVNPRRPRGAIPAPSDGPAEPTCASASALLSWGSSRRCAWRSPWPSGPSSTPSALPLHRRRRSRTCLPPPRLPEMEPLGSHRSCLEIRFSCREGLSQAHGGRDRSSLFFK